MAQTSGQQSNPFQDYKQAIVDDQSIPQIHDRSPLEDKLLASQKKLLRMGLVFNLVSPRAFTSQTIEDFANFFLQSIYQSVKIPSLAKKEINSVIGNIDQVMNYLAKTKKSILLAKTKLRGARNSGSSREDFYQVFHECIECIEMLLKYWDISGELKYKQIYSSKTISYCKNRLFNMHDYFRDSSYTNVDISSIIYYERILREEIILSVLALSSDKASRSIPEKDAVIKCLRSAKMYLNLALDECSTTTDETIIEESLINRLSPCEDCLFEALNCWGLY